MSFFALDQGLKAPAIVPIYRDASSTGKLSVSANMGKQPLFYAARYPWDQSEFFPGHWMTKIAFKSFDNTVEIKLTKKASEWEISSAKSSFQFENVVVESPTIEMDLLHHESNYHLSAKLEHGKLVGRYTTSDGGEGSWSAEKVEKEWWPLMSSRLVPLYEYQNEVGQFRYTTDKAEAKDGTILCRVWENPSTVLAVDFNIRPVSR